MLDHTRELVRSGPTRRRILPLAAWAAAALLAAVSSRPAAGQEAGSLAEDLLRNLEFRSIGPAVTGGRIHDVEALPDDPSTLYVATASGGLWKTTNQGTTWTPLFDDQPVSTFGDVAIAPSDPSVVWAGTGEQQNRQSTSWGNGVYRSTDGGESWTHLGLEDTRHIGKVVVHPDDPDVAWVAALGNLWKPSPERGVYRTSDGGESWQRTLHVDTLTGVVDLEVSPADPDVLYAAAYQRLRRAWGFNGGGPGSGIYRSTDGGESWEELTSGLPEGVTGRIGLAVSPADPDRVWALVEHAEDEGTYRSDDGGDTWRKVNDLDPRPMYYSHIVADPEDPDRAYVLATEFYMTEDGGSTFRQMPTRPTYDVGVHSDHHTLWIDPGNPEHFYLAGDAGLHESFDRGETYQRIRNLPIAQFYAIGLDNRDPYYVYGGLQDNHSFMGPSATRRWIGIVNDDWRQIGFGDGMYQQPDPTSHRYTYVLSQNGGIVRVDAETGDRLEVEPLEPEDEEYRFDWVTPALVSRHDPTTVYLGGNRLFISRDRGETWSRTEDLTKQIDRDTLSLMGVPGSEPMLSKHDGTASFSEITTIAESPMDPDVLWVGTDDGNVQVSRDGGRTWTEVGQGLPDVDPTTYVSRVTASSSGRGVAYVAIDAHRRGDFGTHLFRTTDFGRSWERIDDGFPEGAGPVNDVIEHPDNSWLLFAGTEHGLFVSPDRGQAWVALGSNLPTTLYDDLAIHPRENDLVVGTHGRSIWILDDLTPLERWSRSVATSDAHLFPIREAELFHYWKATSYRGQGAYAGENRPFGAIVHYHLAEADTAARLIVTGAEGDTVRRLDVPGEAGSIHRVTWDLRHEPPSTDFGDGGDQEEESGVGEVVESERILPEPPHPLDPAGPFVAPGVYRVTLVANGESDTQTVKVAGDPQMPVSDEEWHERERFLLRVAEVGERARRAGDRASSLLEALEARRDSLSESGADVPTTLEQAISAADELQGRLGGIRGQASFGLAGSFNRSGVTQGSVYGPTGAHRELLARLEARLSEALDELTDAEADAGG
ncbi:MAG: WD40/YVTN/BNR-like repeat-containing protein [Gemmatimonadota bacterium]